METKNNTDATDTENNTDTTNVQKIQKIGQILNEFNQKAMKLQQMNLSKDDTLENLAKVTVLKLNKII